MYDIYTYYHIYFSSCAQKFPSIIILFSLKIMNKPSVVDRIVIPPLGRLSQEDLKYKASLGYIATLFQKIMNRAGR
jgi:hypothetical protein